MHLGERGRGRQGSDPGTSGCKNMVVFEAAINVISGNSPIQVLAVPGRRNVVQLRFRRTATTPGDRRYNRLVYP